MTIGRLADLHDEYRLAPDTLDVRGWRVYDVQGRHTGIIEDLIVDTATGQILKAILHFENADHVLGYGELTLDPREQHVHLGYSAGTLRMLPTVPGFHPVDRHNARVTFFPELAKLDDWGEVEIEDMQAREQPPR